MHGKNIRSMWHESEVIDRIVHAFRPFSRPGNRKKPLDVPVPVILQCREEWVKVNPPISPRCLRKVAKGLGLTAKKVADFEAATEPFRHPAIKAYFDLVESERRCLYTFCRRLREAPAKELWKVLVGDLPDPERVNALEKRMRACGVRKDGCLSASTQWGR